MSGETGKFPIELPWAGRTDSSRLGVLSGVAEELWPPHGAGFEEAVRALTVELERVRAASKEQAQATSENTTAVIENTAAQASRSDGVVATAGRTLARVFTGWLGIAPLLNSLVGLFNGRDEPKLVPLVKYAPPPAIEFEGYVRREAYGHSSREVGDMAPGKQGVEWREYPENTGNRSATVNITVQVQAIDSRSFIDHSWEIARAVKEAMLESHALNDIVVEL